MSTKVFNDEADRVLVGRFMLTRDEATFRALYRRHTPALYPLALRLVGGSETEAEDAIQETWIRACKTLSVFEWKSTLRTWLSGILINRVREMHRDVRRRNEEELLDECLNPTNARPGERIDLERAIARLSPGYRHVLVLHDIEGYTHEEVSAQLDISIGTSKSQLFHARRALRMAFQVRSL
ncbi:MAG TPA: sigma-70 family RNA polymerase sigma factor [Pyrinomonadaceae bacterium]|nr:sigma-70 family RNA polymerase sigma factor [Pyrinomonadaceae bacterium]